MKNRLARDHLELIHKINVIDDQIHRAEVTMLGIRNEFTRKKYEILLNKLKRDRDALYLLQRKNDTEIERKLLYEKLCSEIGKRKTDEYMKEAFKEFIMLD